MLVKLNFWQGKNAILEWRTSRFIILDVEQVVAKRLTRSTQWL
jgi:hypothetical protein